jgi:hypothetical protein
MATPSEAAVAAREDRDFGKSPVAPAEFGRQNGAMTRTPNLFVIGAMKCGTSSLCHYLSTHPDIFMSPVKEPMHFSRENHAHRRDEYLRLFQGASGQRYLAEGSTEYTKRPLLEGVAERIYQFNPRARLVYVMRDPFARLVSHYRHEVRKGREKGSLLQALMQRSDYLTTSYYAFQLEPYLELFGPQAVYIDTFESLASSPQAFCARLFAWLDIDASYVPPSLGRRLNASPEAIESFEEGSLRVRFARYVGRKYHLGDLLPLSVRQWLKALLPKESVRQADSDDFRREVELARRNVEPLLAKWIAELEGLTGRSCPEWPSRRTDATTMSAGH